MPHNNPPQARPSTPRRRPRRDRAVKLGFLAALTVIAAAVWWHQRSGPQWPRWRIDLPAALADARANRRRVLLLFLADPPGHFARELKRHTFAKKKNRQAVEEGRFIPVRVSLATDLRSDLARDYRIRKLPTLLILDSEGKELNRREGADICPEVPFRKGFLDLTDVQPPPSEVSP